MQFVLLEALRDLREQKVNNISEELNARQNSDSLDSIKYDICLFEGMIVILARVENDTKNPDERHEKLCEDRVNNDLELKT